MKRNHLVKRNTLSSFLKYILVLAFAGCGGEALEDLNPTKLEWGVDHALMNGSNFFEGTRNNTNTSYGYIGAGEYYQLSPGFKRATCTTENNTPLFACGDYGRTVEGDPLDNFACRYLNAEDEDLPALMTQAAALEEGDEWRQRSLATSLEDLYPQVEVFTNMTFSAIENSGDQKGFTSLIFKHICSTENDVDLFNNIMSRERYGYLDNTPKEILAQFFTRRYFIPGNQAIDRGFNAKRYVETATRIYTANADKAFESGALLSQITFSYFTAGEYNIELSLASIKDPSQALQKSVFLTLFHNTDAKKFILNLPMTLTENEQFYQLDGIGTTVRIAKNKSSMATNGTITLDVGGEAILDQDLELIKVDSKIIEEFKAL